MRHALEHVGDPASTTHAEVTYPVTIDASREGEHFHWFVANDKRRRQALQAIEPGGGLPALDRLERVRE